MTKPSVSKTGRSRLSPIFTAIIVAAWLALVVLLVKDRYFAVPSVISDSLQIAAVESDDWFIIRIRGAYSGFARSRQIRSDDHWTIRDELNVSLNLQGRIKPISIVSQSDVDDRFRLMSFSLRVSSGIISFQLQGRVSGDHVIIERPGTQGGGTRKLRLRERPRITRSLGLPLPLTGLKVGQIIRLPIFDPVEGGKSDATIRVLEQADLLISGQKFAAWRVRAEYRAMELVMWIDDEGRLLKGIMPLGITVIRSTRREISRWMRTTRKLPDMLVLTGVPLEGSIPDPRNLKLLRLKVQGAPDLHIPTDGLRQTRVGDELVIKRRKIPEASYSLPCADKKMARFLESSRFIRSDHPKIMEKARAIVGDAKDPITVAGLINQWVFTHLKKVPTPSVPDAYTVLQTKQGDCNEHAILAASLARAVGLPSQVVVGLVYANDGFFYHAWVEYWAGKRWVTGDPLMNQLPADPTHVALIYGDVDKHLNVVSFLGRLKLKVAKAE